VSLQVAPAGHENGSVPYCMYDNVQSEHGLGELVLCDRVYLMSGSGVAGEMEYGLTPGRLAVAPTGT
jgi:hypothetical protein